MASEHTREKGDVLIRVEGLTKTYAQKLVFSRHPFLIYALQSVDLTIPRRSRFGLVGGSGSGKSTLALCIALLETCTGGKMWFDGRAVDEFMESDLSDFRRRVQIVLQDTAGGLNPRMSAHEIIAEPMQIHRIGTTREIRKRTGELMGDVGLPAAWLDRRPRELSGGERQRLAIARALALSPDFLILDEALAGLDLLAQAHIVTLLKRLQEQRGLTYLFISHDLRFMLEVATEIAILDAGKIVEQGHPKDLITNARHARTRALFEAIPGRTLKLHSAAGATP